MKMYFKSGSGIKNPVDFNGNKIKEGDILTFDWFENDYINHFKKYHNITDLNIIEEKVNKPSILVKYNKDKKFYYGVGIEQELYLHDFRFKYTKKLNNEK